MDNRESFSKTSSTGVDAADQAFISTGRAGLGRVSKQPKLKHVNGEVALEGDVFKDWKLGEWRRMGAYC